jgi:hypothetical protein
MQPSTTEAESRVVVSSRCAPFADVTAGKVPFLSVYLAANQVAASPSKALADVVATRRATLPAAQRELFDRAAARIGTALDAQCASDPVSARRSAVAAFARVQDDDAVFVHVESLDADVDSSLDWYRLPQTLPLLESAGRQPAYTLLTVRREGMQLVDVASGSRKVRASTTALPSAIDNQCGRRVSAARIDRATAVMRRALASLPYGSLVIAGDAELLERTLAWLPKRCLAHHVSTIEVPAYLEPAAALLDAMTREAERRDAEAGRRVERLVQCLHGGELAVSGAVATWEALRAGQADTLFLTPGAALPTIRRCVACGAEAARDDQAADCRSCDAGTIEAFDYAAEIAWLAMRQVVDVVVSDSDELARLGGIACVLTRSPQGQVMPQPAALRQLGLVA